MLRRALLCLLTALFFSTLPLKAQLNRSVIEGVVTDPQGAVVPGVEVTALSLETNVSSPARTNNTGYYRLPNLVPGKYQARFTASGFAPLEVLEIQLPAGQTVRVDAEMKLGTSHELVQVTAELPLLETGASNFSASVEERSIQEIPLQGRDIQQLVYLLPGVANVAGPPGSNFGFNSQFGTFPDPTYMQGSDISVNGGQGGANAWYLDGNLNLSGLGENVAVNPSPDSVAEFQVVSNGFAAEFGRSGGGVFSVVLRSGSNAVHGNLYEFVRNSATNARNPFTSIDSTGKLIKDRDLHFNNFGGTLGGPVIIPHLYNGRSKTFFFFSFDHQILHLNGSQVFSVPTARMRQGDFSEDPNSRDFGIWNPYSTVGPDSSGLFARTALGAPLVPNGCLNSVVESDRNQGIQTCNFSTQLPSNLMDPTAMFFVQSFPLPNYNDPLSGCPMGLDGFKICNNYMGGVGSSQNPYNISIKIDHQTSGKSKYFAEWIFNPGKYNIYHVPWTGPTFPYVGWGGNLPVDFKNQIVGLGHTYVSSSTLVNEFRVSFSRQFITAHPTQGSFPDEVTHQTEVNEKLAPARIFVAPPTPSPTFFVGMPGGGFASFGLPGFISGETAVEAYTLLDNITKTLGRHTLKTGFLYRLEHAGRTVNNPTNLGFNGGLAQDPSTGQGGPGLAQLMLGAVDNYSSTGLIAAPYQRSRYWGFYLQDDFRLTPKFTVNLGLRYDLNGFFKTRGGPMSNFCLTCPNPTTGLKGKMIYWGIPEFPDGHDMAPANKDSLGPRVNFSWAPFADRKTIIRGGYDILYTNAGNSYNNVGQGVAPGPQWQTFNNWTGSFYPHQCAPLSGQCVAFPLSDTTTDKGALTQPPVPSDLQLPAAHRDPAYGAGIQFYYPPPRDPMVQMWSLDIQRELPANMMINIGYVGTHGTHLAGEAFRQFNYVHTEDKLKYRTAINANVPITDIYGGKTAELLQQVWGSSTLPLGNLLKDYPFFGEIRPSTVMDGTTIYHGVNLRVQKHYSQGLSFLAAYTFSKKIDNASTSQLAAMTFDTIHLSRPGLVGGRIGNQSGAGPYGGRYQDFDNRNADRAIAIDDIPHMLNIAGTYDLPFGKGKAFLNKKGLLNRVFRGWRLAGTFNAQSGTPLPVVGGQCNQLACRPNLVGNPRFTGNRSKEQQIQQWINPAAFQPVFGSDQNFWANYNPTDDRAWQFGNAGPYLPGIRSPGFWNLDAALDKDFHLTESRYFQFRWEVFNALNHQNLGFPNTVFCLPPGPNGETDLVHQAGCQFGRITNVQTDPRSMQFALKFYW